MPKRLRYSGLAKVPLSSSARRRLISGLSLSSPARRIGGDYYLAVFAERRWAGEEITHQRFAVAVELEHEAQINIHQPLRVRLRA